MGKTPRPEHPVSTWEATGGSDHGEEVTEASQGARRGLSHQATTAVKPMLKITSEPDSLLGANGMLLALFS